jgi:hypothetical protein
MTHVLESPIMIFWTLKVLVFLATPTVFFSHFVLQRVISIGNIVIPGVI